MNDDKKQLEHWTAFWSQKRDPLHRTSDESHYDGYASELRVLLGARQFDAVLELGCGTGTFYERLGFEQGERYLGVDVSSSMLDEFRVHHPDVQLVQGSGHDYHDEHRYDLIFSNGVLQYLTPDMVRSQLRHARQMLNVGGCVIHASVPWKRARHDVWARALPRNPKHADRPRWYRRLSWWRNWIGARGRDNYGVWYDVEMLDALATELGFEASYMGSMHYLYRFHVVLTPKHL